MCCCVVSAWRSPKGETLQNSFVSVSVEGKGQLDAGRIFLEWTPSDKRSAEWKYWAWTCDNTVICACKVSLYCMHAFLNLLCHYSFCKWNIALLNTASRRQKHTMPWYLVCKLGSMYYTPCLSGTSLHLYRAWAMLCYPFTCRMGRRGKSASWLETSTGVLWLQLCM